MEKLTGLILCGAGCVLSAVWLWLRIRSARKYSDILRLADRRLFPVPSMLQPGFPVADRLGPSAVGKVSALSAIGGKEMTGFTAYCELAFAAAVFLPSLAAGCFLSAMSGEILLLPLCGMLAGALTVYPVYRYREIRKERRERLESEFPAVLSKTVLLTNAGMTLTDAWNRVAYSCEGELYEEMRAVAEDIRNGISTEEALTAFSDRCDTKDTRQFAGILERNLRKGGSELSEALARLHSESWENRKSRAKIRGQQASNGLIVPLIMIFIGILVMVIVPLVTGLQL